MSQAIDTLMARRKFPGAQANLNALCRRFDMITPTATSTVLIDADLLAAVYVELLGGRQPDLSLEPAAAGTRAWPAAGRQMIAALHFARTAISLTGRMRPARKKSMRMTHLLRALMMPFGR